MRILYANTNPLTLRSNRSPLATLGFPNTGNPPRNTGRGNPVRLLVLARTIVGCSERSEVHPLKDRTRDGALRFAHRTLQRDHFEPA